MGDPARRGDAAAPSPRSPRPGRAATRWAGWRAPERGRAPPRAGRAPTGWSVPRRPGWPARRRGRTAPRSWTSAGRGRAECRGRRAADAPSPCGDPPPGRASGSAGAAEPAWLAGVETGAEGCGATGPGRAGSSGASAASGRGWSGRHAGLARRGNGGSGRLGRRRGGHGGVMERRGGRHRRGRGSTLGGRGRGRQRRTRRGARRPRPRRLRGHGGPRHRRPRPRHRAPRRRAASARRASVRPASPRRAWAWRGRREAWARASRHPAPRPWRAWVASRRPGRDGRSRGRRRRPRRRAARRDARPRGAFACARVGALRAGPIVAPRLPSAVAVRA